MAGEYVPGSGGKDCGDYASWGQKSARYDYIFKGQAKEDDYPEEACEPWMHGNAQIDNLQVNQNIEGSGTCTFPTFSGNINVQSWKGFDIKHPNKEGQRLRHICLEGPEAGVYVRGKLTGNSVINLPDYWSGLIDPESITVSLTQIGSSQDLIIDKIESGKVYIKSGNATAINCFYTIHASRIDGDPLIIEYDGETPADYPGGSRQFSISGYDYDARG